MRATEFITEIYKLSTGDFVGNADEVGHYFNRKKSKPLPGGSGMLYSVDIGYDYANDLNITIFNPAENEEVGRIYISPSEGYSKILPKPYHVDAVAVLNKYRGQGYGMALYGIVLSELKLTLISGDSQTPAGRKSWVNLASIPGVEVKGIVEISDEKFDDYYHDTNRVIKNIMNLGAQHIGEYYGQHYFAFDVVEGKGELRPAVKNELSTIYGSGDYDVNLFAKWTGK